METEIKRVDVNNELASMPANPWEFDLASDIPMEVAIERIRSVVRLIAHAEPEAWPNDDEWRKSLPPWLKEAIPELTKEETDHLLATTPREKWDSLPWEFGSWLDAVRDRGWRWWGYRTDGNRATVVVHIAMFPERIDAFREILLAAGARISAERYVALMASGSGLASCS